MRTRPVEAIERVEIAVIERGIKPQTLTLGTDNGSQFSTGVMATPAPRAQGSA